jgi:hypothetical protein
MRSGADQAQVKQAPVQITNALRFGQEVARWLLIVGSGNSVTVPLRVICLIRLPAYFAKTPVVLGT